MWLTSGFRALWVGYITAEVKEQFLEPLFLRGLREVVRWPYLLVGLLFLERDRLRFRNRAVLVRLAADHDFHRANVLADKAVFVVRARARLGRKIHRVFVVACRLGGNKP